MAIALTLDVQQLVAGSARDPIDIERRGQRIELRRRDIVRCERRPDGNDGGRDHPPQGRDDTRLVARKGSPDSERAYDSLLRWTPA
jgi:hypothetical protein